jgi:hypothetical protein
LPATKFKGNGNKDTSKQSAKTVISKKSAPKKLAAKTPPTTKELAAKQKQTGNGNGKRPRDDVSDTDAAVELLLLCNDNGAAATSNSMPATKPITSDVRPTRKTKKAVGAEDKSECSWKCQTLSMHLGLKCQVGLVSTSACQGSSFACQACSDHATGESGGSVLCYNCADGAQTKRWYAAKEKGKKHFCLV